MFRLQKIAVIIIVIFIIFPVVGNADIVTIGSDKVSISLPENYCSLDSSNQSDNKLIQYMKNANKGVNGIIFHFADCNQLELLRFGELPNLDDYGYVMIPYSMVNKRSDLSVESYLSEMNKIFKKTGAKFFSKGDDRLGDMIEEHLPSAKLNETKNLGIIFQDNNALYWGLLLHLQPEKGENKYILGIVAMTLVKGKAINFQLYKKYQGDKTIHDLKQLISSWVKSIQDQN